MFAVRYLRVFDLTFARVNDVPRTTDLPVAGKAHLSVSRGDDRIGCAHTVGFGRVNGDFRSLLKWTYFTLL